MTIEKQPFTSYTLDEEKDTKYFIFTIRLNKSEIALIEELKKDFNIKSNGKALKMAAFVGYNVLHTLLGQKFLHYLTREDRLKYSDFKDIVDENVIQKKENV